MVVSFANTLMTEIETRIIQQSNTKPRVWKRYIDDISPFGTAIYKKSITSLIKLTDSTTLSISHETAAKPFRGPKGQVEFWQNTIGEFSTFALWVREPP